MPEQPTTPRAGRGTATATQRWECRCCDPPILLAMYEPGGLIQIKLRDRFYSATGCVHATCPRCGTQHTLDLRTPAPPTDTSDPLTPSTLPALGPDDSNTGWH